MCPESVVANLLVVHFAECQEKVAMPIVAYTRAAHDDWVRTARNTQGGEDPLIGPAIHEHGLNRKWLQIATPVVATYVYIVLYLNIKGYVSIYIYVYIYIYIHIHLCEHIEV